MPHRLTASFLCLLFLAQLPLAGCSGPAAEPVDEPPVPLVESNEVLQVPPIRLGVGASTTYGLNPEYNPDHRVDVDLTITTNGPGRGLTYSYTHPWRPEFDVELALALDADGSWSSMEFPCEPNFPDARNAGCRPHRGGYGTNVDLDGAFFGATLLSGLPVVDGLVERQFRAGTSTISVQFRVDETPRGVAIRPADLRAADVTHGFGHANSFDPLHCSIFSGEVVLANDTGVPLSCAGLAEEDGRIERFPIWDQANASKGGEPAWDFQSATVSPPLSPSRLQARLPPRGHSSNIPFGLWEALDRAAAENATIAQRLADERTWLGTSAMTFSSEVALAVCPPACIRSSTWVWTIVLHDGETQRDFQVSKTTVEGALPTYGLIHLGEAVDSTYPTRFPAALRSVESTWDEAAALLGFEPVGFLYQMPYRGSQFIPYTGLAEPYYGAIFNFEEGQGIAPMTWHRADGTLELFLAKGAIP